MTPPDIPIPLVIRYEDLVSGTVLAENQGQARVVCLLDSHPGWIYKEYRSALSTADEAQMDRLITLPVRLTPAERAALRKGASWPASRVIRDDRTCGVLIPQAGQEFEVDFQLPSGRVQRRTLALDWLAQPEDRQRTIGITPPSLAGRVAVCASLASTAAVLERNHVVYLDWSFNNAFWSHHDHSSYIIDVDGCSFGARPMIGCPGWDDPHHPLGSDGGAEVDRYRLSLLVARCLTTERTDTTAAVAVDRLARLATDEPALARVSEVVEQAVRTARAADRPTISELAGALAKAQAVAGAEANRARTDDGAITGPSEGPPAIQRAEPSRNRPPAPPGRAREPRPLLRATTSPRPTPGLTPTPYPPKLPPVIVSNENGENGGAAIVISLVVLALIAGFIFFFML